MKSPEECSSIEDVRDAIDQLDRGIIVALGKRFAYVKTIMRFKSTEEDIQAPERYRMVLETRREWAGVEGLNPDAIEKMYSDLIAHFIDEERKLLHIAPDGSQRAASSGIHAIGEQSGEQPRKQTGEQPDDTIHLNDGGDGNTS